MMDKAKHNPIRKYLEAEKFVKYCKANNVDVSLSILESYEKAGLLSPIYRLVIPDEYVRASFAYFHKRPFDLSTPFDKDNKWQEITKLLSPLGTYGVKLSPHFKQTLKKGHPLDCAHESKNPFLHTPSVTDFKPWKEYKIVAGTIDGYPIKEDKAEHYYAPWQIFVLEELNRFHTIKENYVTGWKNGRDICKRRVYSPKLTEYRELFQTVSNFRMMESLIRHDMTFDLKKPVIEGELHERLTERITTIAKKEYKKHSHVEWIKFIRKLVELYKEYLKREKIKLSNELKRFLTSTIDMIIYATQESLEKISNEYDGRFKGSWGQWVDGNVSVYPGELERIFPNELKQIRERALDIIESHLKRLNEILPDNAQIGQNIKDRLIDNIMESGHWLLLSHLREIQELWFDRRLHWVSYIWAHIRSLAVSIESVGQEWYKEKYIGNFEKLIKKIFSKDYSNLINSIGGHQIIDAKTPNEYKQKLDRILEHSKSSTMGICGHHLVVANLTRNYLSHRVKFEPNMLGSTLIEVYKALVFTLISLFVKKIS